MSDEFSVDLSSAEKAILGAAIETDGAILDELDLTGADFEDPHLGDIYDAMVRARLHGHHITFATLTANFPNDIGLAGELVEYGRLSYATDDHAAIIADAALRRRLQAAAAGLVQRARDRDLGQDELIESARAVVDSAVGAQRRPVRFLRDILPGVLDDISDDGTQFVATPWPSLDHVIGGFRPGCVYVIGGRTAQGKSVLAQQCAVALAQHGLVAFSSLEMSEDELCARFMSERIPLSISRIKDGTMTEADWARLAARRRRVDDLGIAIDDRANVTVADIRQHARNVSRRGHLAGIVIDYVQLIRGDNPRADRRIQVGEASRQIKVMAKDLRVPVILLSQLTRDPEKRSDGRPRLVDLKETGDLEQDADAVFLIYRHGEIVQHPGGGTTRREAIDLDVAKNRHGVEEVVELKWEGVLSRATEWAHEEGEEA